MHIGVCCCCLVFCGSITIWNNNFVNRGKYLNLLNIPARLQVRGGKARHAYMPEIKLKTQAVHSTFGFTRYINNLSNHRLDLLTLLFLFFGCTHFKKCALAVFIFLHATYKQHLPVVNVSYHTYLIWLFWSQIKNYVMQCQRCIIVRTQAFTSRWTNQISKQSPHFDEF